MRETSLLQNVSRQVFREISCCMVRWVLCRWLEFSLWSSWAPCIGKKIQGPLPLLPPTLSVSSTYIRLKWMLWLRRRKSFTFKGGRRLGDLASATWSHSVFFFFGVKSCTVATKTRIQCKVYKEFLWEKIHKICHTFEGKKKSEVAIFREWVPVGRQNKAGF